MSGAKYQYFASIWANLLSFGYGLTAGWASPYVPFLTSENSPLPSGPVTIEEASWIAANVCLGGAIGTIIFGWLSRKYGRKFSLLCATIPQSIHWLLIAFGINPLMLIIARIFGGVSGGAAYAVLPLFTSEIGENKIRGAIGAFIAVASNFGILIGYIMGAYINYSLMPLISLSFAIACFIGLIFIPESPYFLMLQNNETKAQSALGFYRGIRKLSDQEKSKEFLDEMDLLRNRAKSAQTGSSKNISWSDFESPVARKSVSIAIILVLSTQLCGGFTVQSYASTIFRESNAALDPNLSAIFVALPQFIGSNLSVMLIDRLGRKMLLIGANGLNCLSLALLGLYCYFQEQGYDVESISWLPIICVGVSLTVAYSCIVPVAYVCGAEILPRQIVTIVMSSVPLLSWSIGFFLVKFFPFIIDKFSIYGCLWVFAGYNLFEGTFVLVMLPETKGKSFEDIAILMVKKR